MPSIIDDLTQENRRLYSCYRGWVLTHKVSEHTFVAMLKSYPEGLPVQALLNVIEDNLRQKRNYSLFNFNSSFSLALLSGDLIWADHVLTDPSLPATDHNNLSWAIAAACGGNLTALKRVLDRFHQGDLLNIPEYQRLKIVAAAAFYKRTECLTWLLANMNITQPNQLFIYAARSGATDSMQILLDHFKPSTLTEFLSGKFNLAHLAALADSSKCLTVLLHYCPELLNEAIDVPQSLARICKERYINLNSIKQKLETAAHLTPKITVDPLDVPELSDENSDIVAENQAPELPIAPIVDETQHTETVQSTENSVELDDDSEIDSLATLIMSMNSSNSSRVLTPVPDPESTLSTAMQDQNSKKRKQQEDAVEPLVKRRSERIMRVASEIDFAAGILFRVTHSPRKQEPTLDAETGNFSPRSN